VKLILGDLLLVFKYGGDYTGLFHPQFASGFPLPAASE
jgi:hypothetical protein